MPPLRQRDARGREARDGPEEAQVRRGVAARVLERRHGELRDRIGLARPVEEETAHVVARELAHRAVGRALVGAEQHVAHEPREGAVAHASERARIRREAEAEGSGVAACDAEGQDAANDDGRMAGRAQERGAAGEPALGEHGIRRLGRDRVEEGAVLPARRTDEDLVEVLAEGGRSAQTALALAAYDRLVDAVALGREGQEFGARGAHSIGVGGAREEAHADAELGEAERDAQHGRHVAVEGDGPEDDGGHGVVLSRSWWWMA